MKKVLLISLVALLALGAIFSVYYFGLLDNLFVKKQDKITYVAFKKDSEDRWGLIDMKGKVLVEKEWENEPSFATCGIIRVKNKDGLFEYYTAEEKPKKIGSEYKSAGLFSDNLAAVSEIDKPISFIDISGKEVFAIKELDGEAIEQVGAFSEGMARFETLNKKWGFINKEGKVVVKAKYDFVGNFKEGIAQVGIQELKNKDSIELGYINKYGFINSKGEEVIKLKKDIDYGIQSNGLIPYSDDEGKKYGFINFKEEKLIKPDKDFKQVVPFNEGYAAFSDGDKWGIIDEKGQTIQRPKFDFTYLSNKLIFVNDNKKIGFFDLDGKEVIKTQYDDGLPFFNSTTFVKDGKSYIIIDTDGKQVGKDDFEEIGSIKDILLYNIIGNNEFTESNYFDLAATEAALFNDIRISTINGVGKNTTVKELSNKFLLSESDLSEYSSDIRVTSKELNGSVSYSMEFNFNDNVKAPIVVRKTSGSGYWAYTYNETIGYKLNELARLKTINYSIYLTNKADGKGKDLAELVNKHLQKAGYKLDQSESTEKKSYYKNDLGRLVAMVNYDANEVYVGMNIE